MALYHDYRPQNFSEIIGQEHVTKTLKNQLKEGDFSHAYLFSGPRGIGKTTTARTLAKSLNCPTKEGSEVEPDNSTQCCKEINESRSIDVIEIDAASHTGVQNVRDQIIENAQFQPTKLDYKVFIIDEVHMLSKSAFNALLKTLEEPPEYVVFVLATTEPEELPDTIVSRCQRFDFKKIPHEVFKEHLEKIAEKEKIEVSDSILNRIIDKSDGCIRDGISLLDQLNSTSEDGEITEETASLILPKAKNEDALEFINILLEEDTKEGLRKVNRLAQEGVHMPEFTLDCIELLRFMMMKKAEAKSNRAGVDFTKEVKKTLTQYTKKISYNQIVDLADLFLERKEEIKQAPLPQLPIELLVLQWCEPSSSHSPDSKNNPKKPNTTKKSDSSSNKNKDQNSEQKNEEPQKSKQSNQTNANQPQKAKDDTSSSKNESTQERKQDRENKNEKETKDKGDKQLLEETKENWNKFIEEIEDRSPSLVFILKMAQAVEAEEGTVKIEVEYGFHKEKLTQKENQKHVKQALCTAIDKDVSMEVTVGTDEDDEEVEEIAAALGGEVVN
ncbi:MAG: DNA polymerase III subunit gamma/tau [Candidatus Magasanikbacteria bacterium]